MVRVHRYRLLPMLRSATRFLLVFVAAVIFFASPVKSQQPPFPGGLDQVVPEAPANRKLPFKPGERLAYELKWGVIPAGEAELRILPMTEINGVPTWHFQLTIRSNEFVDVFYKVRDRIDAYASLSLHESLLYRQSQQEGSTRREVEVSFDPARSQATFSNYGEALPPIKIAAGTIDPLTALYFIRSQPLRDNLEIVKPITDGKRNVNGVARVLGREEIKLNDSRYDTYKIAPDLKGVKGVFEKSKKSRMTIWVTADQKRMLVKITSKVVIGSFSGTLIKK